MRTLSLAAVLLLAGPSFGQPCPNGQCPVPQRGVLVQQPQRFAFPQSVGQYPQVRQSCGPQGCLTAPQQPFVGPPSQLGPTPVGACPGPGFQWAHLPGIGWGWVDQPTLARSVPQVMPQAAGDDPQAAGAGKRDRGRLFYLVVRNRAEDRLVEKGVARDEAKRMVAGLSDQGIDGLADQCQIARGLGDGRLLDWILEHKEQIKALIEFIVGLLLLI